MTTDSYIPGIVIQGPLISKGRVPRSEGIPIPNLKKSDIVEFYCVDQIIEICSKYSEKFPIVIATWDSEEKALISRLLAISSNKVKVILLTDTTPYFQALSAIVPGNNKYRQIYSTLKATEELLVFGCTHVIKLRTDMSLDVGSLWGDFIKISQTRELSVLVPSFTLSQPAGIPDVYFVCKSNDLIEFFRVLLSTNQWFPSIHSDLFYRWLGMKITTRRSIVYIFGNTKALSGLYLYAWSKFYSPASYSVFKSIVWRGEKYDLSLKRNIIFSDTFLKGFVLNDKSFILQSVHVKIFNKLLTLIKSRFSR